ncbi:MAG: glycosyltransferase family 4 protein [Candidatus Lokiarchaeota archaeon]|nr:glycosyltransferase family 4 protein [Candidatus Lokiarchaeota archaeon]
MLKICFVTDRLPIHQLGGMEQHGFIVSTELAHRGNQVTVLTTKHPEGIQSEKSEENLEFFYLSSQGKYSKEFEQELHRKYWELHEKLNFNVIYSESTTATALIRDKNISIPIVCLMHGFVDNNYVKRWKRGDLRGKLSAIRQWLIIKKTPVKKRAYSQCDHLITISQKNLEQFIRQKPSLASRISLVYNGIDTELFKPFITNKWREKLNLESSHVIVYTGRITKSKGIHIMIQLIPILKKTYPDIQLLIAGTGNYLNELKKMTKNYDIQDCVHFLGFIENKNVPELLNTADLFIFTTLSIEGLPYNVIEALSCGCAIIGSNSEGVDEIIENYEDGILVNPKNSQQILKEIHWVFQNPDKVEKMKNNARRKAIENFSINKMMDGIINVLHKVEKQLK